MHVVLVLGLNPPTSPSSPVFGPQASTYLAMQLGVLCMLQVQHVLYRLTLLGQVRDHRLLPDLRLPGLHLLLLELLQTRALLLHSNSRILPVLKVCGLRGLQRLLCLLQLQR